MSLSIWSVIGSEQCSHRVSTVQRADRIAVVDHGELVELGTHAELIGLDGRYAALAEAWARSQPV